MSHRGFTSSRCLIISGPAAPVATPGRLFKCGSNLPETRWKVKPRNRFTNLLRQLPQKDFTSNETMDILYVFLILWSRLLSTNPTVSVIFFTIDGVSILA